MKKSVLAFVILTMASIAHAGSAGDFSLLRCGMVLGGESLTGDTDAVTETPSKFDTRMNHVLGAVQPETAQLIPLPISEPALVGNSTTETRLPPKFTLATLGCSWR